MLVTSKEYVQGILEFGNRAPWARCESGSFILEVLNLFKTMMLLMTVYFDIQRLRISCSSVRSRISFLVS